MFLVFAVIITDMHAFISPIKFTSYLVVIFCIVVYFCDSPAGVTWSSSIANVELVKDGCSLQKFSGLPEAAGTFTAL